MLVEEERFDPVISLKPTPNSLHQTKKLLCRPETSIKRPHKPMIANHNIRKDNFKLRYSKNKTIFRIIVAVMISCVRLITKG